MKNRTRDQSSDRKDRWHHESDMRRTDASDMRQANENIRKSQGEESSSEKTFGRRPAIDRNR